MKFETHGWGDQVDPAFPPSDRSKMLNDLITNYKLVGFKYSKLIDLLGVPDYKDSCSLSYKIIEDYNYDIDPIYKKDLVFTFSKDSIITSFKIEEWKK